MSVSYNKIIAYILLKNLYIFLLLKITKEYLNINNEYLYIYVYLNYPYIFILYVRPSQKYSHIKYKYQQKYMTNSENSNRHTFNNSYGLSFSFSNTAAQIRPQRQQSHTITKSGVKSVSMYTRRCSSVSTHSR